MSRSLQFTSDAKADLESIADYIARENLRSAIEFVAALRARCAKIVVHPAAMMVRPDIAEGIRVVVHSRYLILYAIRDDAIVIERIVHGTRHLPDAI